MTKGPRFKSMIESKTLFYFSFFIFNSSFHKGSFKKKVQLSLHLKPEIVRVLTVNLLYEKLVYNL